MTARGMIDYLQPGTLILTPGDRDDVILSAVASAGISGKKVVSGIILTRDIMPHPQIMELLAHTNIPVIAASQDSYQIASIINRMTIKTQPEDSDKIPVIKKLILEHVDIERLVSSL
jgi:BioD-like phosphotransacetylase family protein